MGCGRALFGNALELKRTTCYRAVESRHAMSLLECEAFRRTGVFAAHSVGIVRFIRIIIAKEVTNEHKH